MKLIFFSFPPPLSFYSKKNIWKKKGGRCHPSFTIQNSNFLLFLLFIKPPFFSFILTFPIITLLSLSLDFLSPNPQFNIFHLIIISSSGFLHFPLNPSSPTLLAHT